MMEEVSTMMAYDAHVMEQMSEEEILACLVAETGPTFTVPSKKAKLRESLLQIMDDHDFDEDPVDKYQKENLRLQQTSLRLEQENDNLAHRLITSKVALRNALDKAEDRVDELCKDLLQTRYRLEVTEEEKKGKEEETAKLKELFRRELEKTEQEVRRSSGIITDYKQICSQLTNRLERQRVAHRQQLDSLKSAMKDCPRCRHILDADEPSAAGQSSPTVEDARTEGHAGTEAEQDQDKDQDGEGSKEVERMRRDQEKMREDREKESFAAQIRELEKELAQTKLQLVESKCKIQELQHQKGLMTNQLQEAKNTWINKAFTSLRTSSSSGGGVGGPYSISIPRDGAATLGWHLHGSSPSAWSSKMKSWRHGDGQEKA